MAATQKLLVVEDNQFMRALITELLESEGFEVQAVETASAAVKAAASFDPDAAILDVELGIGPNGFDLSIGVDNRSIPKDAAYLVKESVGNIELLLRAIKASLRGRVGADLRQDREVHSLSNLSRSQLDLLHMAALGLSNTEIAQRRGTTVRAVENLFKRAIESAGIEVGPGEHGRVLAVRKYIETVVLPKS